MTTTYHLLIKMKNAEETTDFINLLGRLPTHLQVKTYESYASTVTHYVTDDVEITQDFLLCLINGVHVVTKYFFSTLIDIHVWQPKQEEILTESSFVPESKIQGITSEMFLPNSIRRHLFSDTTFHFLDDIKERYLSIIQAAGGAISSSLPTNFAAHDAVILKVSKILTPIIRDLTEKLQTVNKRVVDTREIPYAILQASRLTYSNPKYLGQLIKRPPLDVGPKIEDSAHTLRRIYTNIPSGLPSEKLPFADQKRHLTIETSQLLEVQQNSLMLVDESVSDDENRHECDLDVRNRNKFCR